MYVIQLRDIMGIPDHTLDVYERPLIVHCTSL